MLFMDNKKRNVHNSGPLGMLLKSGQVNKLEYSTADSDENVTTLTKAMPSYFKTQSGIEFSEYELIYVDPKECEPWKYANRQENEFGDIEELVESIKNNKQLQPALIQPHSEPHNEVKYEIIFGCRRHIACLKLGIPFLAIKKNISNIQKAIAAQDAENKVRNDVSNYSNATLYKKLLDDKAFNTQKELAEKLRLPTSSLTELMSFTKIPDEILNRIPNVHALSIIFAITIVSLLKGSKSNYEYLLELAPQIGKKITSPARLRKVIEGKTAKSKPKMGASKLYKSNSGEKLFTLKFDQRGAPSIVFNKQMKEQFNIEELCNLIKGNLDNQLEKTDIRIHENSDIRTS